MDQEAASTQRNKYIALLDYTIFLASLALPPIQLVDQLRQCVALNNRDHGCPGCHSNPTFAGPPVFHLTPDKRLVMTDHNRHVLDHVCKSSPLRSESLCPLYHLRTGGIAGTARARVDGCSRVDPETRQVAGTGDQFPAPFDSVWGSESLPGGSRHLRLCPAL